MRCLERQGIKIRQMQLLRKLATSGGGIAEVNILNTCMYTLITHVVHCIVESNVQYTLYITSTSQLPVMPLISLIVRLELKIVWPTVKTPIYNVLQSVSRVHIVV